MPGFARAKGSPFGGAVPPIERWRWSLAMVWRCAVAHGEAKVIAAEVYGWFQCVSRKRKHSPGNRVFDTWRGGHRPLAYA